MDQILIQLNQFLGKAMLATYAGEGKEVKPQRPGFKEFEYSEEPFYYRDSYMGWFKSAGQETVWYNDKPFWTQLYGGGMFPEYQNDQEFASQTFDFLKQAMSAGDKSSTFQPRGLNGFKDGDWQYTNTMEGDITQFKGEEKILYRGKPVFFHYFFGGLVKWK
jgi:hypothetical protein